MRSTWHTEAQPQIDRFRKVTAFERLMDEIARARRVPFVVAQVYVPDTHPIIAVTRAATLLTIYSLPPVRVLRISETEGGDRDDLARCCSTADRRLDFFCDVF
jgi:hypothetical protein